MLTQNFIFGLIFAIQWVFLAPCYGANTLTTTLELLNEVEIDIIKYPAEGKYLLILPYPLNTKGIDNSQHQLFAQSLVNAKIETWYTDMTEAMFLQHNSSTLRKLTGKYTTDLIRQANKLTGKIILLAGSSYAAVPILRSTYQWHQSNPLSTTLRAAILFSPKLYKTLPSLGENPKYLPIVSATNIPLIIFQGGRHGNSWQLPNLLKQIHSNNSNIYVELMPDISMLLYGNSASKSQKYFIERIGAKISNALGYFSDTSVTNTTKNIEFQVEIDSGVDSQIKRFRGNPTPLPIKLQDYNGLEYDITNYQGKVTVINFWATWCKPCVKEIPSLNRLKKSMTDKPFQLISINFSESPDAVKEFQKMVEVDFPVLMDRNGKIAAAWKVIAFPSTYVIGIDGKIQYGINAGIEWDTPQVKRIIRSLYEN